MLNLVDNKKLLHTYQLYSNRHYTTLFQINTTRPQYVHPIYCEWCKRIWIFIRKCKGCEHTMFCCGGHEEINWCTTCLLHSKLKK